jgi:hypothetical protein
MFQKPTIFGTPTLSGGLLGDADTEGCCGQAGDGTCGDGSTFTPTTPPSCGWGVAIAVGVTSGLTGAGTGFAIGKAICPGPVDAG